jgi:hypothetical protein
VLKPSGSTDKDARRGRGVLIANQISITLALLVGTFLVVRAKQRILKPELGYDENRVVAVNTDFAAVGYSAYAQRTFYDQLVDRIRVLPGVEAVALSSVAPFQGAGRMTITGSNDETLSAWSRAVSPTYFRLTGTRVLRGHLFSSPTSSTPDSPMPVVVSQALAHALSAGPDVVGKRIHLGTQRTAEIIGVVADVESVNPGELDGPMLYTPIEDGRRTPLAVLVRVAGNPHLAIEVAHAFVRNLDPIVPVTSETMATTITRVASQYSSVMVLSAASSALAVCVSFVGLFGMMTFAAAQRAKEVSIRLTLGAQRRQIVRLFMRSLVRPLMTGLSTGMPMALMIAVLLRRSHVLVAVNLADPWPYAFALTLVVATVGGATVIPAVIAARAEPSKYLRQD